MDTSPQSGSAPRRFATGCLLVLVVPLLVWLVLSWLMPSSPQRIWSFTKGIPLSLSADGQFFGNVSGRVRSQRLATYDLDGYSSLELRHTTDSILVRTVEAWAVNNIAVSPDQQLLATSGRDQVVQIWRLRDGALLHTLQHTTFFSPYDIDGLTFSPDSHLLASGGDDGMLRLWRVQDGALLHSFQMRGRVMEVAFSPDGKLLAAAVKEGQNIVRLWRVSDGGVFAEMEFEGSPMALAFSPDGQSLALGFQSSRQGEVQILRVLDDGLRQGHSLSVNDWVFAVAFSPDGRLLATGGGGYSVDSPLGNWRILPPRQTIQIWRTDGDWSGWPVQTLSSPQEYIKDLAFSPDGRELVASGGNNISVFAVAPRSPLWSALVPGSALATLAWIVWRWRQRRKSHAGSVHL